MGDKKTTSETKRETWPEESLAGIGHHVTRISDGERTVESRDVNADKSARGASDKWKKGG